MELSDTKTRLLDTAERLFARSGVAGVSLRQIVAAAEVNLAAVNYHFRSKEGLVLAVFERRLSHLSRLRLQALEELEAKTGQGKLPVRALIEAFVRPALRLSGSSGEGGASFMRLLGRTFIEPDEALQEMLMRMLRDSVARFTAAFQRALPKLPAEVFYWRIHFAVGAMAHTMCERQRLKTISGGRVDVDNVEGAIQQLVDFLAAGLLAPVKASRPGSQQSKSKKRSRT